MDFAASSEMDSDDTPAREPTETKIALHRGSHVLPLGAGHEEEPLGTYLAASALFVGLTSACLTALYRTGRKAPIPDTRDIFLLSGATLRISRLIARDRVMSPIRAPFTEVAQEPNGEIHERPRGTGTVRALGELVTCPRCTAMWAAGVLCMSYVWAPNAVRPVSLLLTCSVLSDIANRMIAKLG